MRLDDLAVFVLQQVGAVAVQTHRRHTGGQRGGVATGFDAVTGRFDADQADTFDR